MTESPDNDGAQATPPLQPFTMPSAPPGPEPAPQAAAPGAVPPQPGPPAAGDPARGPWAVPGQTGYGQRPPTGPPGAWAPGDAGAPGVPPAYGAPYGAPPGYGPPYAGYQPYPASSGAYPPMGKDPALAEWWRRLLARVIDYAVVLVITSPIWGAFLISAFNRLQNVANPASPAGQAAIQSASNSLLASSVLIGLASAAVWFVYDWLQHGLWGQTLGKRALGTKVVRAEDRGRISPGAAAARAAVFALPPVVPTVGGLFQLVNVLSLTWDRRRQCFHDKAARTIVVKKSALS